MAETLTEFVRTCYRGQRIIIPFVLTPPGSMLGQTVLFTLSKKRNSSSKLYGPLSVLWDDQSIGSAHVVLAEEQTDQKPGTYYCDVWRTDEGFETPLAIGKLVILANSRVPPVES